MAPMETETSASAPITPQFKDRRTGLIVFGILEILLGGFCVLLMLLMLVAPMMAGAAGAPRGQFKMLLPAVAIYGLLAAGLIALGSGSILCRRWARALSLVLAWSWLVMGAVGLVLYALFLPKMLGTVGGPHPLPETARLVITVVALIFMALVFVALPGSLVLFYGSRQVKATCEARDPVPRWTDACPLPVLAMSLWLWFAVPMFVMMPVAYHGVAPFFGTFLTGVPGGLFYLFMAVIWAWAAWRLYRLDVRAWWVLLVALVLFSVSGLLTYAHHDIVEMYRLMGYPEAQIEQIQKSGLLAGNHMAWLTGCSMVPFLGYLLFVKKYLRTNLQPLLK